MRALILLLALLLAPSAAARDVVEGELRFPDGVRLEGLVETASPRALLDLAPLVGSPGALLEFARAEGYLVEKTRTVYRTPLASGDVRLQDARNASVRLGEGSLAGLSCGPECTLVAFADGRQGSWVGTRGAHEGPLAWLREPVAFWAGFPGSGSAESFHLEASPGWSAFEGQAPRLGERVGLFLWNVTGELRTQEETRPFRTGIERRPLAGGAAEEVVSRYLVLHLDGPRLAAEGPGARLWADAPQVRLEGALEAPSAEGTLRVGARAIDVAGRSLRIEGALALRPAQLREVLPALDVAHPLRAPIPAARVGGEASHVRVGGAALALEPQVGPATAAGALALAALLAAAWHLHAALLSPFYMRIDPRRVLANPNRARIHRLVAQAPGATAADLVRLTGLARVVVDHHLRALVAHGHLAPRGKRYRVGYFLPERAPDEASHARADALRDATRRDVARAVLAAPDATQKDLSQRLGLRQRLVSHHLARLEAEGLVEVEWSMPRRYRPAPGLAEALGEVRRVPVLDAPPAPPPAARPPPGPLS